MLRENTNIQNNQFLKVKNSFSELGKDFMGMKDRELKDREGNSFTSRL